MYIVEPPLLKPLHFRHCQYHLKNTHMLILSKKKMACPVWREEECATCKIWKEKKETKKDPALGVSHPIPCAWTFFSLEFSLEFSNLALRVRQNTVPRVACRVSRNKVSHVSLRLCLTVVKTVVRTVVKTVVKTVVRTVVKTVVKTIVKTEWAAIKLATFPWDFTLPDTKKKLQNKATI